MAFSSRVDRAYARFCRTGDPEALGRVFDATAVELTKIATYALGDRERAQDVVQSAFLLVIEKRAEFDRRRRVMPWLCGIVANLARTEKRRLRRVKPVSAIDPSGEPSCDPGSDPNREANPARALENDELRAELRRIRESLPEPYRPILELHLEHGLNAKEIARVLDRPAGSVRTQIVRGLELLRRRLPRDFAIGIGLTALATSPLTAATMATMREFVLRHAAAAVDAGPVAATATATTSIIDSSSVAMFTGGIVEKKLLLVGVASALLLAVGAWSAGWLDSPTDQNAPGAQAVEDLKADSPDGLLASTETPSPTRERSELTQDLDLESPGTGEVEIRIRWKSDGAPAANQDVQVVFWDDPYTRLRPRRGSTDATGHVRLTDVPTGAATVQTATGQSKDIEVVEDELAAVEITAEDLGVVLGEVVDSMGRPVADADIWIASEFQYRKRNQRRGYGPGHGQYGSFSTRSAHDGSFEIRVASMQCIAAFKPGFGPSEAVYVTRSVRTSEDKTAKITLKLTAEGGALSVAVRDAEGRPIRDAHVVAGTEGPHMTGTGDANATTPALRGNTDRDGVRRIDGLAVGPVKLQVRAPGFALWQSKPTIAAGGTTRVDVTLEVGAVVQGRVLDDKQMPVVDALVYYGKMSEIAGLAARTDASGQYRLVDLPLGERKLTAWKRGSGETSTELTLRSGEEQTWDAELSNRPAITGVVRDSGGRVVVGAGVTAWTPSGGAAAARAVTDEEGRFALGPLKAGVEHSVVALVPFVSGRKIRVEKRDVMPDTEIALQATAALEPTVVIRGRVSRPDGRSMAGLHLGVWPIPAGMGELKKVEDDGRFEATPRRPGRIRLEISSGMKTVADLGEHELVPHQILDLGDVVIPAPGSVHFEVEAIEELVKGAATFYRGGRMHDSIRVTKDNLDRPEMPPGDYVVCVRRGGDAPRIATAAFAVKSGETTDVALTPIKARRTTLRFTVQGEPVSSMALIARDADGSMRLRDSVYQVKDGKEERVLLPEGNWKIELRAEDGRSVTKEVEVPTAGEVRLIVPKN